MALVPLPEWRGVDLDDGTLDEGVGTDEFVVRGVVVDGDDAGLAGHALRAPGVVAYRASVSMDTTEGSRKWWKRAECEV